MKEKIKKYFETHKNGYAANIQDSLDEYVSMETIKSILLELQQEGFIDIYYNIICPVCYHIVINAKNVENEIIAVCMNCNEYFNIDAKHSNKFYERK
jgi:hypothetical protein